MTWNIESVSSHTNQQKRKPNAFRNSRKKQRSLKSQRPSKRHHVSLRRMSKSYVFKSSSTEGPHQATGIINWSLNGWCDDDDELPSGSHFMRDSWERKPFKNKIRLPSIQSDPITAVHVDCLSQPLSPSAPQPTDVPDDHNISFRTHIGLDRHNRLSDGMSARSILSVNRPVNNPEWGDLAGRYSKRTTKHSIGSDGAERETERIRITGECESFVTIKEGSELRCDSFSESVSGSDPSDSQAPLGESENKKESAELKNTPVRLFDKHSRVSCTAEVHPDQLQCLRPGEKHLLPIVKPIASNTEQSNKASQIEEEGSEGAVGSPSLCTGDHDSISLGDIDLDMESLVDTLRSLNCHDALQAPLGHSTVTRPFDYHRGSLSTSSSVTTTSADISTTTESTGESFSTHGQTRISRFSQRRRRQHHSKKVRVLVARRPRKILVLGDMMSGKTNLISSYCKDQYQDQYIPTLLRCVQTDATVRGEKINLVVLDISGRDDFAPLRRYAYYKVDAVVLCYPVDSIESLERLQSFWVPELKEHAPKAPFVVVGTKRDIRDEARDRVEDYKVMLRGKEGEAEGRIRLEAEFAKTFVSYDRGKRLSNKVGAQSFYECSSMYRDGTRNLFESVTMIALQKSRRKRKATSRHLDTMCSIL